MSLSCPPRTWLLGGGAVLAATFVLLSLASFFLLGTDPGSAALAPSLIGTASGDLGFHATQNVTQDQAVSTLVGFFEWLVITAIIVIALVAGCLVVGTLMRRRWEERHRVGPLTSFASPSTGVPGAAPSTPAAAPAPSPPVEGAPSPPSLPPPPPGA